MFKSFFLSIIFYLSTILYNYTSTDLYLIIQLLIINSYLLSFKISLYIILIYELINHHKIIFSFFKFILNLSLFNILHLLLSPLYFIHFKIYNFVINKRQQIINKILSFGLNMVLQGKGIINQINKQNKKDKKKNKKNKNKNDEDKLNNIINLLADNLEELNKNIDINNTEDITDNLDDYFN